MGNVKITEVTEEKDGAATFYCEVPEDSKRVLIEIGLKLALYCVAFNTSIKEVFKTLEEGNGVSWEDKYREAVLSELSALSQAQEAEEERAKLEEELKKCLNHDNADALVVSRLKEDIEIINKNLKLYLHPHDRADNQRVRAALQATLKYYSE